MTESIIASGPVLLELRPGGIAHIRLNKPESANSMDTELLQALHQAVIFCHSDERVRVVVLTGAGKNFCAGGDVKVFASHGDKLPDHVRKVGAYLERAAGPRRHQASGVERHRHQRRRSHAGGGAHDRDAVRHR